MLRQGRRIVVVLAGMNTMKERGSESAKLIEWAYREFNDYRIAKAGDVIDQAPVWMGDDGQVPVAATKDVTVTLPRNARPNMKVVAVYDGPVKAPVAVGQAVGKLVVTTPDAPTIQIPLAATAAVGRLGGFSRIALAAGYLIYGKRN